MKMLEFLRPKKIETKENKIPTKRSNYEISKSQIFDEAEQDAAFIEKNHTLVLDRLVKLVGVDKMGSLLNMLKQDDRYQREICKQVRDILIKAVHEHKLQSPSEVVPWEGKNRYREYMEAVRFLENPKTRDTLYSLKTEEAKKLVNTIRQNFQENEIFRKLYGKKNGVNQHTGEHYASPFFRAFENKDDRTNHQPKSFTVKRVTPNKELV